MRREGDLWWEEEGKRDGRRGRGEEKGGKKRRKEGGKIWWVVVEVLVDLGWLVGFARFCCGFGDWSSVSSFKLVSPVGSTMAGRNAAVHPLDIGATVTGLSSKIRLSGWGWWRIEGGGSG